MVKPSHVHKRVTCSGSCRSKRLKATQLGEANPNFRDAAARTCIRCQKSFRSYQKNRKYCGRFCADNAIAKVSPQKRRQRRQLKMKSVLMIRRVYKCRLCCVSIDKGRQYCVACTPRGKRLFINCAVCSVVHRRRGVSKTCSKNCSSILRARYQRGERSHRWQGGKTAASAVLRNSAEYVVWRRSVFERDNFTCFLCKSRGGRLTAHHIFEFAKHEHLRLEPKNGLTLCWPCHGSIRGREEEFQESFCIHTGLVVTNEREALEAHGLGVE